MKGELNDPAIHLFTCDACGRIFLSNSGNVSYKMRHVCKSFTNYGQYATLKIKYARWVRKPIETPLGSKPSLELTEKENAIYKSGQTYYKIN